MSKTQQARTAAAADSHMTRKDYQQGASHMNVHYVDLISEGPVEGLVGGPSGVFLGGSRVVEPKYSPSNESTGSSQIVLGNGSEVATIQSNNPNNVQLLQNIGKERELTIVAGFGSLTVSSKEAAWITENDNIPAVRLTTLGGSSFFTASMVGKTQSEASYTYEIDKANIQSNNFIVATEHRFNTGDKVKLVAGGSPANPVGGLTHNGIYYVRLYGNNAISLHTTLKGAVSENRYSLTGAVTLNPSGGTAGVRSTLVKQPGTGDIQEPVRARLKGIETTDFSDIEGNIVRYINGQNAFFIPGVLGSYPTGLPPDGVYTIEVDKQVHTTINKPASIFTGLTQGGLLFSHEDKGVIEWDDYLEEYDWLHHGNGYTTIYKGFQGYENLTEMPAPSGEFFTGNTNNVHNFVVDNLDITTPGASSYSFMGYFKPPATGYYEFQLLGEDTSDSDFLNHGRAAMFINENAESVSSDYFIAKPDNFREKTGRVYLYENVFVPIKVLYSSGAFSYNAQNPTRRTKFQFKWRAEGGTFSTDLSNHFYSIGSDRNWQGTNQVRLREPWPLTSGTYDFVMQSTGPAGNLLGDTNFKNASVQFRSGGSYSGPMTSYIPHNLGGMEVQTAITNTPSPSTPLEIHSDFANPSDKDNEDNINQGVASTIVQALDPNGLNLSAAQLQAIDVVQLNFDYPNGLHTRSKKTGNVQLGGAYYQIGIQFKELGETSFSETTYILEQHLRHTDETTSARTFSHLFDISRFKPFKDFRFIIKRRSVHTGIGYWTYGPKAPEERTAGELYATAQLGLCTSFDRTILAYPHTSIASVSFSTAEFQETPQRLYHTRGLKVRIPNNYLPREASNTGVAKYTLQPAIAGERPAIDTNSYYNWDGRLTDKKHYTNNPAWIFYDLLTNKRYGLGDFIKADDLDIYSLYRVARYCDELVPDGRGGLEPRFTCNVYITKKVDAYKLLKDLATVFRGILYWHNGKLTPVIDQEKDPVFNFTQANVIDGAFSYEGSGSKTRANQLVVTWNNPENGYSLESLLVEDSRNIAETGVILQTDAVAVGCTSKKQAERYGRWKLWTSINQTEVISFQAALESQFLSPGDIINVLDNKREQKRFAGRITSDTSKSLTTSEIPLDGTTFLNPDNEYKLFITHSKPGAYLAQDSTQIDFNAVGSAGQTYQRGQYIPKAWVLNNGAYEFLPIDTEEKAANAKATRLSLDALNLHWSDNYITEERPVSLPGGHSADTALSSLSVSSAFSETPKRNSIWLLEETSNLVNTTASAKMYKILNLTYDKNNLASITAVEHYNKKFEDIENDGTFITRDLPASTGYSETSIPINTSTETILVSTVDQNNNPIKIPAQVPVTEVSPISDLIFRVLDDYEN